ncbi:hypothetical protein G647_03695 [Cladophialophora carrionii CBS 160.54]|uniref:Kelch repeat protein n=1 Tax=Cladophialophora carrionii CBS 160.54 TaxID=1279043 RepID=V9DC97_9EURO|nr:uncharacterized protein G647_03695 [Cladophialophora carrionii CBS 160.54]ETI24326.1 hypothetical protein G647_03695 [Cladophialophora carrionii CBS 160.54]
MFYEPDETGTTVYHFQEKTVAVDLTQSWTNQTVTVESSSEADGMIDLGAPQLFYDKPQNKVSRYGGWPLNQTDFPSILWSFDAGRTDVIWENDTSPSISGLSQDSPGPYASATVYTDTTFYSFGGNIFPPTGSDNMTVLSGLVTKDLVGQFWTNTTAELPEQSKYRTQARMVHAPNFGAQGFLVMVGGESPPTEASGYRSGMYMVDMATITLYDIETGTWYTQTATGDIPPPRSEFCAVGAVSSDGTSFEVFVYGGSTNTTFDLNNPDDEGYLNVYALSLPAFRWFKSESSTPVRRARNTCSVIGKRQMVSIGGLLPSSLQKVGVEPDPWPGTMGVFDMTEFEWTNRYNAIAAAYESPEIVQRYYRSGYDVPDFSDAHLASVFAFTPPASSTDGTNDDNTTPTQTPSPNGSTSPDTSSSSESTSSSSNAGPIAGGVVGGVALIAAILFGIWFCQRRRKQRSHGPAAVFGTDTKEPFIVPPYQPAPMAVFEVADNPRPSEMDAPMTSKPPFLAELPADRDSPRPHGVGM